MTFGKMKVDQLRSELKSRGLGTGGTKPLLLARLQAALDAEESRASTKALADRASQPSADTGVQVGSLSPEKKPTPTEADDAPSKPLVQVPAKVFIETTEKSKKVEIEGGDGYDCGMGIGDDRGDGIVNAEVVGVVVGAVHCTLSTEQRVAARSTRFGGTDEGRRAARAIRFRLDKSDAVMASKENTMARSFAGAADVGKRKATVFATADALEVSPEEQTRRDKRAKRFAV